MRILWGKQQLTWPLEAVGTGSSGRTRVVPFTQRVCGFCLQDGIQAPPPRGWHHWWSLGFGKNKSNPGRRRTLEMSSSWQPTNDSGASLTLGVTGWVRWEDLGGEETQVPALLAPLSLPSCLTRSGEPVRATDRASRQAPLRA